jgi:hypothetical protein
MSFWSLVRLPSVRRKLLALSCQTMPSRQIKNVVHFAHTAAHVNNDNGTSVRADMPPNGVSGYIHCRCNAAVQDATATAQG